MRGPARVLGVAASLGKQSHSAKLVAAVLAAAEKAGARVRLVDLRQETLPMFTPGEAPSEAATRLRGCLLWADAVVLGSPDYHGGMSGAMKNFLDHFWKEMAGRLFGYVCSSHEGGVTAMQQMRTAIRQCYGWSLPYNFDSHPHGDIEAGGKLREPARRRAEMMGHDLARYGKLLRRQFEKDRLGGEPSFAAHYKDYM